MSFLRSITFVVVSILILSAAPSFGQDYLVGSQDVLKITVFGYPDLTTEARVSEEGKITFPLLGEIVAKNLTTRQLEKSLAERLSKGNFVKDPQVNVFMQQYRGRKVTIIGEVMKPGQYEISGPTTVLDVISLSLGMTQNAGYQITIFRKEPNPNGKEAIKKISLDVDRLLNAGDLTQDIELQNSDIIYVSKAVFYIYGEVNRPGAYRLEKGLTIKRAVALAGGLTPKASQRRIEVTRKDGEKEALLLAGIDDQVLIDDVVMIKESIF